MSKVRGRVSAEFRFEASVRSDVHERRWVRVHVMLIGLVTFGALWGMSHWLMRTGVDSMALRHGMMPAGIKGRSNRLPSRRSDA